MNGPIGPRYNSSQHIVGPQYFSKDKFSMCNGRSHKPKCLLGIVWVTSMSEQA